MNDKVKIGDYVYILNDINFDISIKYKVAYIYSINRIIIECPRGWRPTFSQIIDMGLQMDKRYWFATDWIVYNNLILDNE